ncbi:S-adenosyl-L-methionine-dependent methyltransferase [Thozetella sp. PMI_491]|nr:S-adenosyl-L-methionine-dependent methyltransferase [Thozetella sp. PMI_491]
MAEQEPHIEVDTADDRDSVVEDDIILDYPVENGRRYHAFRAGVYCLPNDELELDRLDLTHALMTKGIGEKLFLAPIDTDKMHRVLDIGTGTGIWSMAVGDEYPNAQIIGNDLSATQPPWVCPNVKFEIDDVEAPWVYEAPFNYIFCRYMTCCIADWPKLVERVHENLVPGGWAEFQDFDLQYYSEDGSLTKEHKTLQWINLLLEAARKIGREPCPGPLFEGWVTDAGFENVTHKKFRFPIGPWAKDGKLKEVGMFNLAQVLAGLEAFSLRLFCQVLGWDKDEVLLLTSQVRKELKTLTIHAQFDFHVVYGQKKVDKP